MPYSSRAFGLGQSGTTQIKRTTNNAQGKPFRNHKLASLGPRQVDRWRARPKFDYVVASTPAAVDLTTPHTPTYRFRSPKSPTDLT